MPVNKGFYAFVGFCGMHLGAFACLSVPVILWEIWQISGKSALVIFIKLPAVWGCARRFLGGGGRRTRLIFARKGTITVILEVRPVRFARIFRCDIR
jgi:hypothetical protein